VRRSKNFFMKNLNLIGTTRVSLVEKNKSLDLLRGVISFNSIY
jgi:hypothetical protein